MTIIPDFKNFDNNKTISFNFRVLADANLSSNPEFQYSITQLTKSMHAVHEGYNQTRDSWEQRKTQLDQGIQLRMFEADCQKVPYSSC